MKNDSINNKIPPLQVEIKFKTKLPPTEAFSMVAFQIPQWFEQVHKVNWDHSNSKNGTATIGACSARECLIGNKVLKEEIITFDQDKSYSYRVDLENSTMKMPIKNHLGFFEVKAVDGGSLLTWRQHFQPPVWPLSAIIRWYMRDRMMKPAVRNFVKKFGGELC